MADDGKDHDDRDDRDEKDEGFDPWADLESEGTTDFGEGFSFSGDDVSLDAGLDAFASEPAAVPPGESGGESVTADDGFVSDMPVESGFVAAADGGALDRAESESPEEDAFVNAWLNDAPEASDESPEEEAPVTPLSVFAPDDHAEMGETDHATGDSVWPDDPSAIEIGTGQSGVTSASDIDAIGFGGDETFAPDEEPVSGTTSGITSGTTHVDDAVHVAAESIAAFGAVEGEGEHAEADVIDFGAAAAGAAALAAVAGGGESATVAVSPGPTGKGKSRKRGLLGTLLGVVFGGLLAIPVVLGILIGLMWMGWQDTTGIRSWMPSQLAFLLPQPRISGGPLATVGQEPITAPSLDDLPAVDAAAAVLDDAVAASVADTASATEEPEPALVTEDPAPTDKAASSDPLAAVPAEPPVQDEPAAPNDAGAMADAAVAAADPLMTPPAAASLDDLAAIAPPMPALEPAMQPAQPGSLETVAPVVSEPEPLDQGVLEAAIADAASALDAVEAVADPADPVRKTLLVDWYKQLARAAQELSMLEHVAADSGRPLPETPASVADLGGRILATPEITADLARLARNWLTYSRRDGDGVVMPATFSGVRRVGPYWCSRVSIAEAGGATRELSVISRVEPAAAPGDAVVIMGLVMDGGVLWASDLRSAAAGDEPAAAVEADPFGRPGL
jgi:hypothetical protein